MPKVKKPSDHDLVVIEEDDIEVVPPSVETDLIPKRRKTKAPPPRDLDDRVRTFLRKLTRYLEDIQKLRIQQGNRKDAAARELAQLTEKDAEYFKAHSGTLIDLENSITRDIAKVLDGIPVWESFLKDVKGIGPRLGGVLLSEFDIRRARTASSFSAYAGLAVDSETGEAVRKKRGERAKFDPRLKAKVLEVLGGCLLKAKSQPWSKMYYGRRHRRKNQLRPVCALCEGAGAVKLAGRKGEHKCPNCGGSGGPAPWGRSDAHRHRDALRYMVNMFLDRFYYEWAKVENIPVRPPYAVEYLGRTHFMGAATHQGGLVTVNLSEFSDTWADHCHLTEEELEEFIKLNS